MVGHWKSLTYILVLVNPKLILELLEDVLEVVLVLHDVQHYLLHLLVQLVHLVLELLALTVNQDDLDDVWEVLLVDYLHELLLLVQHGLLVFGQVFVFCLNHEAVKLKP